VLVGVRTVGEKSGRSHAQSLLRVEILAWETLQPGSGAVGDQDAERSLQAGQAQLYGEGLTIS
jgi:hypothetical protein